MPDDRPKTEESEEILELEELVRAKDGKRASKTVDGEADRADP